MADEHATLITSDTIIWLKVQPLAHNSSPYLYNYNHNIFLLLSRSHEYLWSLGCPNYNKLLQLWQDESRRYREAVIRARNNDHDWLRRYSMDYSYFWAATHCCLQIYCNLFHLPLYSLHGLIHRDRVLWETMEWMAISFSNECPSLLWHVRIATPIFSICQNIFIKPSYVRII